MQLLSLFFSFVSSSPLLTKLFGDEVKCGVMVAMFLSIFMEYNNFEICMWLRIFFFPRFNERYVAVLE